MAKAKKKKTKAKVKVKAKGAAKAKTKVKAKAPGKSAAKPKAKAKKAAKAKPAKAKPAKAKAKAKPAKAKSAEAHPVIETADERATAVDQSKTQPRYEEVRKLVLEMFRNCYPSEPPETDTKILATDPNEYDVDPSPFYEYLEEKFAVDQDENNQYFGGYGGKIESTIAFLASRWNGTLHQSSEEMNAED